MGKVTKGTRGPSPSSLSPRSPGPRPLFPQTQESGPAAPNPTLRPQAHMCISRLET